MKLAEYCIGGPAHGRLMDNPEATRRSVFQVRTLDSNDKPRTVYYHPRTISLFGARVTVWAEQGLTTSEAGPLVAEVLLAPHYIEDAPETVKPSPLTKEDRAWIEAHLNLSKGA